LCPGHVRPLFNQNINAVIFEGLSDHFKIPDHSILGFSAILFLLEHSPIS
jgi:hypothetical protein